MERIRKLTPEMKADIQAKKELSAMNERIQNRNSTRTIFRGPAKQVKFMLPEDFTGKDLKKVHKLIKQ